MTLPIESIDVLHVDDDSEFTDVVSTFLERADERIRVESATSVAEGLACLDEAAVDCIVSDFDMPGDDGLAFLGAVREDHPDLPFILLTGKGSEEIASEAISAGVTDYVQKDGTGETFELLANRIVDAVERVTSRLSYREVFEKAGVGLTVRDLETFEILDANRRYCDLLGYDLAEIRDLSIDDITADVEGYDAERAERMRERALAEGAHTFEWPDVTSDGELRWVEITLQTAEIEGQERFLTSIKDVTDRRQRQAELAATKNRLELALEGADLGVWDWNIETNHITYDERWAEMLGYDVEDLPNDPTPWLDNIHPDDKTRVMEAVEEHGRGETDYYECEHRMQTASGDWKWIHSLGHVVERTDDGEPLRAVGLHQDVTERKEAQRQLEAERDRFVEGPTVVFEWGFGGEWPVEYVSPNVEDLLGYPAAELEGGFVHYADVVHPEDFDRVAEEVTAAVRDREKRFTHDPYRVRTAGGDIRWIYDHTVIEWQDDEPVAFLGYVVDITERKEFEQGLTALQSATEDLWTASGRAEVFDVLFDTAAQFLAFDDCRILTVEDDSLRLVRTSDDGAVDEPAPTAPHDDDRYLGVRAAEAGETVVVGELDDDGILANGERHRSALTVPIDDRFVFQAAASSSNAYDERDRELTELLADHVRTTLTRLEQEGRMREQREALRRENERLEDFVRIVSHDLRNPLNVVQGRLELAESGDDEFVQQAQGSLDRAFELIEDLLSLAREGEAVSDLDAVSLEDVGQCSWRNVDTGPADLVVPADRRVEADRSRLKQLLENLFANAVEHGGEDVTVTLGTLPDGFHVADDGGGVPEDEREDVFDAGYSTEPGGTGFGLSIVEQIATAHGWDVAVAESAEGGARFELTGVDVQE